MKRIAVGTLIITVLMTWVCPVFGQATLTPETALQGYLNNGDKTYRWELQDTYTTGGVKAYDLLLTSQQWHEYVWTHQLIVLVPDAINYEGSLLFISSGSNSKGLPNRIGHDDKLIESLGQMAAKNKGIVACLRQTPNQPLYGKLTEDALISYTLHQFKEDGDYSWPLLFPMVKGAVRAMDAVQEFANQKLQHAVKGFVVTGLSKRGWTTWLTGANDPRVMAIAPMVIDVLNMPVNLDYQVKMFNGYSEQIEDYVKLGIPQAVHSERGEAITKMVDPYSYREKLTMPKMIFMGTSDQYWTVDAIKHYIDSIPGKNFIHYVPNAGHNLGDKKQALAALSAFFGMTISGRAYTACEWDINYNKKGIALNVKTSPDKLVKATLWYADSPDTDFRDDPWTSKALTIKKKSDVLGNTQSYPTSGYRAFYIDLKYKDPNGGEYSSCTRMFLADEDEVFVK